MVKVIGEKEWLAKERGGVQKTDRSQNGEFLKCQETMLAWGENVWIRGRSSALFVWICCALNVQ